MFQTEWQGIRFADLGAISPNTLPGPRFYEAFYEEFFLRHQSWDDVSPRWRAGKDQCANLVLRFVVPGARVLAVGCGLGYIEHRLLGLAPQLDLAIQEVAPGAWRWVADEVPDHRRYVGPMPGCVPSGARFDLVYLSAVDYALSDHALVDLLGGIRSLLSADGEGGRCLMISASLLDDDGGVFGWLKGAARSGVDAARVLTGRLGLPSRMQFWGWSRTRREYRDLLRRAQYLDIQEGFVNPASRAQFWIAGR